MEILFYILLSLKTADGFDDYGQYFIGNDREAAHHLFRQLKGDKIICDSSLLHIDLMETVEELPVKIKTICCNLDELAYISKLIVRGILG